MFNSKHNRNLHTQWNIFTSKGMFNNYAEAHAQLSTFFYTQLTFTLCSHEARIAQACVAALCIETLAIHTWIACTFIDAYQKEG